MKLSIHTSNQLKVLSWTQMMSSHGFMLMVKTKQQHLIQIAQNFIEMSNYSLKNLSSERVDGFL